MFVCASAFVCVFVCRLKEELIRELGKSSRSANRQGELYRRKIQALEQVSATTFPSDSQFQTCDMHVT